MADRSSPRELANSNVSMARDMCAASSRLLITLAICPDPRGPTWITGLPKDSKIGLHLATSGPSPPIMTSNRRSSAATADPLTGASTTLTPRSAARSATRWQVLGCTVEWMATTPPADIPASTPSDRSTTSSTSSSENTQIPTTSLRAPSSAGVPDNPCRAVPERVDRGLPPGPYRQRMSGVRDPKGHRSALITQTDKPHPCHSGYLRSGMSSSDGWP